MRRLVSLFVLTAVLATVTPSLARAEIGDRNEIPLGLDVGVMRPVGMIATIGGMVVMVPVGIVTLATRPSQIGLPFDAIVGGPARFTWMRPLGESWGGK